MPTAQTSGTPITNPQAVLFCNSIARPLADKMIQLYYACLEAQSAFTAQGLAAVLPNSDDTIVDGSATDGRSPITDGDVNILLSLAGTYITNMQASSNLQFNQVAVVAVNFLPPTS